MRPFISIVVPTLNRSHLIGETLESVISQTYQNWECLIVDDGSTDSSLEIYKFYEKRDKRLKFFNRSVNFKPGGNGARNMGLEKAKGEWVMFLDSDDLLVKNSVMHRVKFLKSNEHAEMLIFHTGLFFHSINDCDRIWNIVDNGDTSHLNLMIRFLDQDLPWHTTGVLWKKQFLNKIGGWNEELLVWQDWEIHLRALIKKPILNFSEELPDNFYRQNVENSIASKKNTINYYIAVAQSVKNIEPLLLGLQHPKISNRLKYLIIRFFIIRPLDLKNKKLQIKILLGCFDFKTLSRPQFLFYYFLEFVSQNQLIKKIFKKIYFKNYYRLVKTNSTHLAIKFNVDYSHQKRD